MRGKIRRTDTFFELLAEFNKGWAKNPSALALLISKRTFDHNGAISPYYQFDAGAATENVALEASSRGFAIHMMGGFDRLGARENLAVPDDHDVIVMIAIGKQAPRNTLPEVLQVMEVPSGRKPLTELVMEGRFR